MTDPLQPADAGDVKAAPVPTSERVLLGCLFVPIALAFVLFALGGAGVVVSVAFGVGPLAEISPPMAAMCVLLYAGLTWFFGGIARRLLAGMRGRPVPTLIPPFIGPIFVGLLAVTCLVLGVAGLLKDHADARNAGRTLTLGVLCAGYVVAKARSFFAGRRGDAQ
jgi:hypothetical protein